MQDNNACISIHYNIRCKYWHGKINFKSNLIGFFFKLQNEKSVYIYIFHFNNNTLLYKHIASYTHDNAYNSCVDNKATLIKNAQSIRV